MGGVGSGMGGFTADIEVVVGAKVPGPYPNTGFVAKIAVCWKRPSIGHTYPASAAKT